MHYTSMEDYGEHICEDSGGHTWGRAGLCLFCDAQRCNHREIVYGRSVRCERAVEDDSEGGGCVEHERSDNEERLAA